MTGVWDGSRFVVIDTETTGLHATARVLAVAVYCLENGATVQSWSTLVNPGEYGAAHIHGLDPAKLARARPFAAHADHLRDLLTQPGGRVFLVAHNVAYDAARLAYEYSLLGQELPELVLLDTRTLAQAAGRTVTGSTLDDLAGSFGLANPAKHEANADALVVREVALRCLAELDGADVDLTALATPPPVLPAEPPARPAITAEHAALHDLPLTSKRARETALGGCLALSCPDLHKRIEDGITTSATARACYEWALAAMNDGGALTRLQRGLLVAGAARALAGWRDTTARPDHALLLGKAVAVLATGEHWTACDEAERCDYCQAGKPDRCRFVRGPRRLLWPALYASKGRLVTASGAAYLTGSAKTPLTGKSWWTKVHAVSPETANSVAVTVAAALRQAGHGHLARPAVEKLWKAGHRDARLAVGYAAILEDGKAAGGKLAVYRQAAAVCEEALNAAAAPDDRGWQEVRAKLARLNSRINAATRKPPASPYNTRPAHRSRFVRP